MNTMIEELAGDECVELLARHNLGRIAVLVDGYPVIFPVNYVARGSSVVFRTNAGTKLDSAALGRVSFEIDGGEELGRQGWSVVVQGIGNEITDSVDRVSEALRQLPVDPWIEGDRSHWVAVTPTSVTGRRLVSAAAPAAGRVL